MDASVPDFQCSVPGKVFLLGEYLVLYQGPAILAAVSPRFEFQLGTTGIPLKSLFHPNSPAGLFLKNQTKLHDRCVEFRDPYDGHGGFGSSTAEFLFALSVVESSSLSWQRALSHYLELFDEENRPSGADLITQLTGGIVHYQPELRTVDSLAEAFDWNGLMVFSAAHQRGRKVKTHDHLKQLSLSSSLTHSLKVVVESAKQAIDSMDAPGLGKAFDQYAQLLNSEGLECQATLEDRMALRELDGVLGVKGSGALQSDVILVLTSVYGAKGLDRKRKILEVAEQRGLKLITEGLKPEKGLEKKSL